MDPLERAALLKTQADFLLSELRLAERFAHCGGIYPTGSYFMDLLVYPDIDIYIPKISIPEIFAALLPIAEHPLVEQLVFDKMALPDLPGGLYCKPRIRYGDWERPWKMDIWFVDRHIIETKMHEMQRLRARLTPELRECIIQYKLTLINDEFRTPPFSGYFIYKAVLDEGLEEPEQIRGYLVENGIKVR